MISFNGQIDSRSEPEILKTDADFPMRSVYTSVRTYEKKPFRLDDHLRRLQESARLDGFELPQTIDQIRIWIAELLEKIHSGEQFIKIIATPQNILINSRVLVFDEKIYEGVRVISQPVKRSNVKAKISAREDLEKAYQAAIDDHAYEALLYDEERNVLTEGSRSNILWIKGGVLHWCNEALSGITQKTVLEVAQQLGIPTQQSVLLFDEIAEVDEIFLTQTSKGIVPVTAFGSMKLRDGSVGPLTKKLMQGFADKTNSE